MIEPVLTINYMDGKKLKTKDELHVDYEKRFLLLIDWDDRPTHRTRIPFENVRNWEWDE